MCSLVFRFKNIKEYLCAPSPGSQIFLLLVALLDLSTWELCIMRKITNIVHLHYTVSKKCCGKSPSSLSLKGRELCNWFNIMTSFTSATASLSSSSTVTKIEHQDLIHFVFSHHSEQIFVSLVFFLLVMSCFLFTVIKCAKGHKSQRLFFKGVL